MTKSSEWIAVENKYYAQTVRRQPAPADITFLTRGLPRLRLGVQRLNIDYRIHYRYDQQLAPSNLGAGGPPIKALIIGVYDPFDTVAMGMAL